MSKFSAFFHWIYYQWLWSNPRGKLIKLFEPWTGNKTIVNYDWYVSHFIHSPDIIYWYNWVFFFNLDECVFINRWNGSTFYKGWNQFTIFEWSRFEFGYSIYWEKFFSKAANVQRWIQFRRLIVYLCKKWSYKTTS